MATLRLESSTDVIDLDEQFGSGKGYQAHAGAMGFGLPDAEVQWFEGAGSGSIFRGRRVQSRELDLPISILAEDREELESRIDRLTVMLSEPCRLVRRDDSEHRWVLEVVHAGGADYSTGRDTNGETEWHATLQLRSGWPAWRREPPENTSLSPEPEPGEKGYGEVRVENIGSADAWPEYRVQGPGSNFEVRDADGYGFKWTGTLEDSDALIIRTEDGTVVDSGGANRYGELARAPRMMPLKPGGNPLTVTMEGKATGPGGAVIVKASDTPSRINEAIDPRMTATSGTATVRENRAAYPRGSSATTNPNRWWSWSSRAHNLAYLKDRATPFPQITTVNRIWVTSTPAGGASNAYLYSGCAPHSGLVTLSAYVRSKGTVQTVYPLIRCTNGPEPADLSEDIRVGPATNVPQLGRWVRISITGHFLTGTHVRFGVMIPDAVVGDWLDMTAVLIEPVPELRDYFDAMAAPVGIGPPGTAREGGTIDGAKFTAPAPRDWTATGFAKAWVHDNSIYMLSAGDSGRLYGPSVPTSEGDSWVGSVQARRFFGGETRLSIVPGGGDRAIARSHTAGPGNDWSTTLSASGGGTPMPADTTSVRPMIETFGSGETRYRRLLMEKSTNLGSYFAGDTTDTINGIREWEGEVNNSRSLNFDARWERASLTSISYQPRRWAVI